MDNRLEQLNSKAVKYFKNCCDSHAAIAVSGSEESLVLLNAAASVLGSENVICLIADTGYISEEEIRLIIKACDIVNVNRSIIPVNITETGFSDITHTVEYKRGIFEAMLQECWLLGYDTLYYGCTIKNYNTNGNEVIPLYDGTAAPLII